MGVDEEIAAFFRKDKQKPYLGSDRFRDWVYRHRQADDSEIDQKALTHL